MNRMKHLIATLFTLLALCFAAGAQEIMYVTSPDGLRVRSAPSLQVKTIDTHYYGEYVLAAEKGAQATIDGITANWVKVRAVNAVRSAEGNTIGTGWVFGGYLE